MSLTQLYHLCETNPEFAERHIEEIIWRNPDPNFYNFLGLAKKNLGKFAGAIDSFRKACRYNAQDAATYYHIAMCFRELGRLEEACETMEIAVKLDRSCISGLAKLSLENLDLDKAVFLFQEILATESVPAAHVDLSYAYGLLGRWEDCFREYEWRFDYFDDLVHDFAGERWKGESLNGRTLLVYCEQGYGDWIQFVRYVSLIKGGTVVLYVPSALVRLFRSFLEVEVFDAINLPPQHDLYCSVMSLPHLLHEHSVSRGTYLPVVRRPTGKIGVVWKGKSVKQRAIPTNFFETLAQNTKHQFVSLQYGDNITGLPYFLEGVQDFEDTRERLEQLDLLITADTVTMHLAGAMGIPCWALLWYYPHWIWPVREDHCPWYDSVIPFRQTSWGDWTGVYQRVLDRLREQG